MPCERIVLPNAALREVIDRVMVLRDDKGGSVQLNLEAGRLALVINEELTEIARKMLASDADW